MTETCEDYFLVICLDEGNNTVNSYHGVYDSADRANEEAKRMNNYELANHPYSEYVYKVEKVRFNYESEIGKSYRF